MKTLHLVIWSMVASSCGVADKFTELFSTEPKPVPTTVNRVTLDPKDSRQDSSTILSNQVTTLVLGGDVGKDVQITIPAGALQDGSNVALREAQQPKAFAEAKGTAGTAPTFFSKPIELTNTQQQSQSAIATTPMTIAIPFANSALRLQDFSLDKLCVLLQTKSGDILAWRKDEILVKQATAIISSVYFGTYQLGECAQDVAQSYSEKKIVPKADDPCVNPDPSQVATGVAIKRCDGSLMVGTLAVCTRDGESNCLATRKFAGVDTTALKPEAISSALTIAGVKGSLEPCQADAQTGCITTPTFKAANTSGFKATDLAAGKVVAGVVGTATAQGYPACSSDGQTACLTHTSYKAADTSAFNSSQILSGTTIAGVQGSAVVSSHALCSSDGQSDCVTSSAYKAAKLSAFAAADIVSGKTIAGVAGSATAESHGNCTSDGQLGCIATASYKAANMAYVIASNILTGVTIAGVPGAVQSESHSNCVTTAAVGCVTTAAFKSVDMVALSPGLIKNGASVANVTGAYPSASYPLASNTGMTDLTTFITQMTSAGTFEFFDSTGTRHTGSGDTDLVAANIKVGIDLENISVSGTLAPPNEWDLRVGVVVGGVTGKLKTNCRNRINSTIYNYDGSTFVNSAVTTGTALDWWDTIDDYNNNGVAVPGSLAAAAGWTTATDCNASNWEDVTADGTCNTPAEECMFRDRLSGLTWSEVKATSVAWRDAVFLCQNLTLNGLSGWRLPTHKELLTAHVHGIRDVALNVNNSNYLNFADEAYFWSATTTSSATTKAWAVSLRGGDAYFENIKANANFGSIPYVAICVR